MTDQNNQQETTTTTGKGTRTFSEELEVAGNQLVSRVQDLIAQGNVRRIIIRNAENEVLMDINLTVGAVVGGVVALAAWWIAALAVIAAMVARVKIEIVREEPKL
jgi:hypothetical protein